MTSTVESNKSIDINNKEGSDNASSNTSNNNKASSSSIGSIMDTNSSNFKFILLVAMVLQNSLLALVGRYTRSSISASEMYVINHLVLTIEVGKLILSVVAEHYYTNGKLYQSFDTYIVKKPYDTLKSLVPALLYLLQNTLLYVALGNLTAPMFQVTYQGKLVTTAIVSVILLNRTYNIQQWICLIILSFGVAVVVLGEDGGKKKSAETENEQSLLLGLTCVTISCFSSAFAGVYFEKVLKTENKPGQVPPASLWMRNIQLSFFSILIAAFQGYLNETKNPTDSGEPYFYGFTFMVWTLVFIQSAGGLLVAAVMKYADNVLKGLATGVSVVLATFVSIVLFNTPITFQFTAGATLILSSAYYFSNPLPLSIQRIIDGKNKADDEAISLV